MSKKDITAELAKEDNKFTARLLRDIAEAVELSQTPVRAKLSIENFSPLRGDPVNFEVDDLYSVYLQLVNTALNDITGVLEGHNGSKDILEYLNSARLEVNEELDKWKKE